MLAKYRLINVVNLIKKINRPYSVKLSENSVEINNNKFVVDDYTNINSKILSYLEKKLHLQKNHPLAIVKQRIINYFYKTYTQVGGTPLFSVYDRLSPVVSIDQNFDSLLIPKTHISRTKSDCYYLNRNFLLRAHCTAHQVSTLHFVTLILNTAILVGFD